MNTTAFSLSEIGPLEPLAPWALNWGQLALYALAMVGVTYSIGRSTISMPFRTWLATLGKPGGWALAMLECPKCLGFHLGWIAVLLHLGPFESVGHGATALGAFVTCALMLIADRFDLFDHEARRGARDAIDQAELEDFALKAENDRRRSAEMESVLQMQKKLLDEGLRSADHASRATAAAIAFPPKPGEPV